ncbi:MAG: ATP-grasp domain-containing protein [Ruminococcaceae bacterium]|nr:ATP-grasp domain-containing protein [Oscillospiraceae bacterium]
MGLNVATLDYDENAVSIPFADKFYNVSTIDIEGVTKAAEDFKADGIMTLASDMPMRSVAKACEKLGLSSISFDTAVKATDKGEMIKAFKEKGVPSPWFFIAENEEKLEEIKHEILYPCILKPLDNSGSRGVVLVDNEKNLIESFKYSIDSSRGAGVIIEEYMQGNEVSVELIMWNGQAHVLAITDKLTTGAPHFVEMGHLQQSRLSLEIKNKIKKVAIEAVKSVGIENGPAHVEIMVTSEGPKMIELGARMGGDCITTHLVPLSTGIDMVEATIKCALGEEPDVTPKFERGSAIRYFSAQKGIIKSISGVEEAKEIDGIKEITFTKNVGEKLGSINSSNDRTGFVIAQADTAESAVKACEEAIEKIKIKVKEL